MALTYEGARAFTHRRAPWLIPTISTTSASGNVAYLIDTVLWTDTSSVNLTAQSLNGLWILWPDTATATDRERRVGGNSGSGLDLANGRIYPTAAWGTLPGSAVQYELSSIQPRIMFDLFDEVLHDFYLPTYSPLYVVSDGDMAATGTTGYSVSGAGALSKVTTAANNDTGTQSLFVNYGTAAEYMQTPGARVQSNTQYFASLNVRADAGGPFAFAVWDTTNDVEIESGNRVSTSHEQFMSMQRTFTTPSTCEEIAFRLYCTANTDDAYVSAVHGPFKSTDQVFSAPSWLLQKKHLRKLMYADYQYQASGVTGLYDAASRSFTSDNILRYAEFYPRLAPHHANPTRIEIARGTRLQHKEIWLEGLRRADEIYTLAFTSTGETSPSILIDETLLGLAFVKRCCEYILSNEPEAEDARETLASVTKDLNPMLKDYEEDLQTPSYAPAHSIRSMGSV